MNRTERRSVEKKLGLTKHYKTLSRSAKWDLQAERIILGKQRQEETKEKIKQSLTEQNDAIESKRIFTIAESIAKTKNISISDATEEAKIELASYKK
jgi:hypothetical protein